VEGGSIRISIISHHLTLKIGTKKKSESPIPLIQKTEIAQILKKKKKTRGTKQSFST